MNSIIHLEAIYLALYKRKCNIIAIVLMLRWSSCSSLCTDWSNMAPCRFTKRHFGYERCHVSSWRSRGRLCFSADIFLAHCNMKSQLASKQQNGIKLLISGLDQPFGNTCRNTSETQQNQRPWWSIGQPRLSVKLLYWRCCPAIPGGRGPSCSFLDNEGQSLIMRVRVWPLIMRVRVSHF